MELKLGYQMWKRHQKSFNYLGPNKNKYKQGPIKDLVRPNIDVFFYNPPKNLPNPIKNLRLKGYIEPEKVFAKLALSNPSVFCKYIFNLDIFPFQHVVLKYLLTKSFVAMVATRGYSKSLLYAIYAAMKAIIDDGSNIIIAGASFRQSKTVMEYIEKIYYLSPIFREICNYQGVLHASDTQSLRIGNSTIKAIPLTGDTIRGLRANTILVDEVASVSNEILNVVIRGFAAVSLNPYENVMYHIKKERGIQIEDNIKPNQFIVSGTADYQFNHFYKIFSTYKQIIEEKMSGKISTEDLNMDDVDYKKFCIIQVPYTAMPKGYLDADQITNAMATTSKEQFDREWKAIFPGGTEGFYPMTDIENCTAGNTLITGTGKHMKDEHGKVLINPRYDIELHSDGSSEYVMGIDPARSNDNFAIVVYKLDRPKYKLVYANSWHRTDWTKSTFALRDIINVFKPVRIGIDAGGGGMTIKDNLCSPIFLRTNEQQIYLWNDEAEKEYKGLHILELVQFSNYQWCNESHFSLQGDLYHRRIMFPCGTAPSRVISGSKDDRDPERILDEICKTKLELNNIVLTQTHTGLNHFDVPNASEKKDKSIPKIRKDRFSALLIGAYIARSYIGNDPIAQNMDPPPEGDKVSNLVGGPDSSEGFEDMTDYFNTIDTNVYTEF